MLQPLGRLRYGHGPFAMPTAILPRASLAHQLGGAKASLLCRAGQTGTSFQKAAAQTAPRKKAPLSLCLLFQPHPSIWTSCMDLVASAAFLSARDKIHQQLRPKPHKKPIRNPKMLATVYTPGLRLPPSLSPSARDLLPSRARFSARNQEKQRGGQKRRRNSTRAGPARFHCPSRARMSLSTAPPALSPASAVAKEEFQASRLRAGPGRGPSASAPLRTTQAYFSHRQL